MSVILRWSVRQNQNGSNELLHYGVPGMKWGVRKERYSKKINDMSYHDMVGLISTGKDFSIRKGEKLYRITNEPKTEKGRLYVSGNKQDANVYQHSFDSVGGTYNKSVYRKEYTINKNLKVAGIKTQAKELYKIFKDPAYKNIKTEKDLSKYVYGNKDVKTRVQLDVLNKKTKERDKMIKSLTDKGYDVAVDIVDVIIGFSSCPLVVLDSEAGLGEPIVKKVFDKEYLD